MFEFCGRRHTCPLRPWAEDLAQRIFRLEEENGRAAEACSAARSGTADSDAPTSSSIRPAADPKGRAARRWQQRWRMRAADSDARIMRRFVGRARGRAASRAIERDRALGL